MRHHLRLALVPALACPALAQFPVLPAPSLVARTAPRAEWSNVASTGLTATGSTFRCDNPGAATDDLLYVFGGCLDNNTSTTLNDLWAFDPVAGTFAQVNDGTGSPAPHARCRASVAWNPLTQRLIVFGGDNRATGPLPPNTLLNDTWEYDPVADTWTDVTPAGGNPSPRRWAAMAFEPQIGGMLLFGGDVGAGSLSNETWLFIGGAWAQLSPVTVPPARRMASLVTRNDAFQDVLMCGGDDSSLTTYAPDVYRHLDVWTWSGGDWTLISSYDWATQTGTFPASAFANQAVYDPLRKRVVLQGGQGIAANTASNKTYLFGTTLYNGSPTNYTSEFDCLTNSWTIYANPTTGSAPYNNTDPSIGRISRYFAGFVPATGKVYKSGGQDPTKSFSRPTYNVYEYQASPVAAAADYGAGCAGPGGTPTLAADDLPWTGRTLSATCTNLGPTSLTLSVWGATQTSVPLAPLLPLAGAGCLLLNDVLLLAGPDVPAAGQVQLFLPIVDDPTLAGTVLQVQVAELEFSGPTWVGLYTSNGVTLTVGAL